MCLYPRIIENRKYRANKKNGGDIPPMKDHRTKYVPIGCQSCKECRDKKAREWTVRLEEEIKRRPGGKFITLTFSTKSLKELVKGKYTLGKNWKKRSDTWPPREYRPKLSKSLEEKGYDLDNAIATKSMRYFLERWRKKYGKSLRHWMVTELGHGTTEHMHMHGIVWTDTPEELESIWGYGTVWRGKKEQGKRDEIKYKNYVNGRTIGYMVKYVSKIDVRHINYKPVILTSPGIGNGYNTTVNKYNGKKTNETYRMAKGHKVALPIYWRNKAWTDEEREQLWIDKLDKGERYVCGEKVDIKAGEGNYYNLLYYHRERTKKLGYPTPKMIWSKRIYEEQRRQMLHGRRIGEKIQT